MQEQFAELLNTSELNFSDDMYPFLVGRDRDSLLIAKNLVTMPHLLVCGASGTGKTSYLQTALALFVAKSPSRETRLVICASNISDYQPIESVPNLYAPIIHETNKTAATIKWLFEETQKRYTIFADAGVKDLAAYNRRGEDYLPRIVLVIDDLFDLFSVTSSNGDSIGVLQNVLAKGRQVGVHCILVTATPSNTRLQKTLVPHIPCRMCFAVASSADSKAILGQSIATKLDFPGKAVFKGFNTMCIVDTLNISEEEVTTGLFKNLDRIDAMPTTYDQSLLRMLKKFSHDTTAVPRTFEQTEEMSTNWDDMLADAAQVVLKDKMASVSMLQRRLKLNYSRAARIVDQLEECGVVGPFEGSKPRAILVDNAGWEKIARNIGIK